MVAERDELYLRIIATARNSTLIRAYLDDAPDSPTYEHIAMTVTRA